MKKMSPILQAHEKRKEGKNACYTRKKEGRGRRTARGKRSFLMENCVSSWSYFYEKKGVLRKDIQGESLASEKEDSVTKNRRNEEEGKKKENIGCTRKTMRKAVGVSQ